VDTILWAPGGFLKIWATAGTAEGYVCFGLFRSVEKNIQYENFCSESTVFFMLSTKSNILQAGSENNSNSD